MAACRYGISLRVFNLISQVEHSKRNSISTSSHVLSSIFMLSGEMIFKLFLCSLIRDFPVKTKPYLS